MLRFLTPMPALWRGFEMHPDDPADPYAFKLDFSALGAPTFPVVFSRAADARVMTLHLQWMPLSAERQPERTNQSLWAKGTAALGASAVLARTLRETIRRG